VKEFMSLIVVYFLQLRIRTPYVVAALFGVAQVRSPLDRSFAGTTLVVGEDSGVVVGVVLLV
jgi:hypothetical protein